MRFHGEALKKDWVIHAEFSRGVRNFVLRSVVGGDAEDFESLVCILLMQIDEPRRFHFAGRAPRGPKIYQHSFAFVVGEVDSLAVERLEFELGGGLAAQIGG